MHSSVISKAVFIMIALIALVSCEQGGSKVKAHHTREAKSGRNATQASTTRNSKVASASTATATKNTVVYNGITQFDAQ